MNKKHDIRLLDRNTTRDNFKKLRRKIKHKHKKTAQSGILARDGTDKGR